LAEVDVGRGAHGPYTCLAGPFFQGLFDGMFFLELTPSAQVGGQPVQGLLEVFQGIGIGQAQEAFAPGAKINARGHPDLGVF
jgi:hypothetical protein